MNQERANYVESEFEKWKDMFEINYINEYDVKLLLSLRHQLEETPDEKIKTKVDLINAIKNLSRDLKLKPKAQDTSEYKIDKMFEDYNARIEKQNENKEKTEILILVDTYNEIPETADIIVNLLGKDQITKKNITKDCGHVESSNHSIRIRPISEGIRGLKPKGYIIKHKLLRDVYEALGK